MSVRWARSRRTHVFASRSRPGMSPTFCAVRRPRDNAPYNRLAFKTGTSYGYRDAWAAGFDRRNTIAVWVGRPDNEPVPGLIGRVAGAPILFDAFARIGSDYEIIPKPADALVARTLDCRRRSGNCATIMSPTPAMAIRKR